ARKGLIVLAGLLMAVLLVVSLVVIMNTVRLGMFARREEIAVMRYVGATKTFVVMPFIVEGIIIGLTAAVLAFIVQYYLYTYVITDIALNYGLGTLAPFGGFAKYIAAAFLGVGLFAGVIASGISVKRYLNA
ncbi:MAG: ABC transporter permease, partial [Clostridia bacterium]|nr:ABC transporter permease [Clostridia bacterium]